MGFILLSCPTRDTRPFTEPGWFCAGNVPNPGQALQGERPLTNTSRSQVLAPPHPPQIGNPTRLLLPTVDLEAVERERRFTGELTPGGIEEMFSASARDLLEKGSGRHSTGKIYVLQVC